MPSCESRKFRNVVVSDGGTIVLAGLLDGQADDLIAAYETHDFVMQERGRGEWPVVVLRR